MSGRIGFRKCRNCDLTRETETHFKRSRHLRKSTSWRCDDCIEAAEKSPRRWSAAEVEILHTLRNRGLTVFRISAHLPKRSMQSIERKLRLLGYCRVPQVAKPKPVPKDRPQADLALLARLRLQDGLSYSEIGDRMGKTRSAIGGLVKRHRKKLHEIIAAQRAASCRTPNGAGRTVEPRSVEPGMRGGAADHAERGTARAG